MLNYLFMNIQWSCHIFDMCQCRFSLLFNYNLKPQKYTLIIVIGCERDHDVYYIYYIFFYN